MLKFFMNKDQFIIDELKKRNPELFEEISCSFSPKEESLKEKEDLTNEENLQEKEDLTNEQIIKQFHLMIEKYNLLEEENKKLEEDGKKTKEQLNFLKIEFQSYIKKTEVDIEIEKSKVLMRFGKEIISVMKTLDLAKQSCQHDSNILIGLEMLEKQF